MIFLLNKYVLFRFFIQGGQDTAYLVILVSIVVTCLLWFLVALLTRPDPEEKLIEFYRRTRPMGWWGPIAEKTGIESAGPRPVFSGLGIAFLGTVAVAAGTIGFSCLYIGRWGVTAVATFIAVVAGLAFKQAYNSFLASSRSDL
ncbi:hypothetical protein MYX78_04915 [Acidobacteria bacterium AH-259-G07]|nr:hypothetical protein [Acidobacteria bacterium AH-259-G07]